MSPAHTYVDYLADMVDCCDKALRYIGTLTREAVEKDEMRIDALIRVLTVLGEASKRVGPPVRERFPDVPWKRIAGLRDILIHRYESVDYQELWNVLSIHVPAVLPQLREIHATLLAEEPPAPSENA